MIEAIDDAGMKQRKVRHVQCETPSMDERSVGSRRGRAGRLNSMAELPECVVQLITRPQNPNPSPCTSLLLERLVRLPPQSGLSLLCLPRREPVQEDGQVRSEHRGEAQPHTSVTMLGA
jgi:hypothetical protein